MDIYLHATDKDGKIRTIYLLNKGGTFFWAARYYTHSQTNKQVVFNGEIRKVNQSVMDSYIRNKELEFEFKEEDLELLGQTLKYAKIQSTIYHEIYIWTRE